MPEATSDAMTGLGVPAQVAALLGANPAKTTGAANNTQTGAAVLLSRNTELNPGSTTNSFIPPAGAGVMEPYFLTNTSATAANVFVPVGHTLNGTLNGSILSGTGMVQYRSAILWQYKPKFWTYILGATT